MIPPHAELGAARLSGSGPNDSYLKVGLGQASGAREPCTNFIEVSVLVFVEPAVCMGSDLLTKPEFKSPVVQDAFADEGPDRLRQLLELYRQLLRGTHGLPDNMHSVRMHDPPPHTHNMNSVTGKMSNNNLTIVFLKCVCPRIPMNSNGCPWAGLWPKCMPNASASKSNESAD